MELQIVRLKKEKRPWGASKIRELLVRRLAGDARVPATSTVHAVLDRHGLVKRARQRRRSKAQGTPLSQAHSPHQLWFADYKGEFRLGNGLPLIKEFENRFKSDDIDLVDEPIHIFNRERPHEAIK